MDKTIWAAVKYVRQFIHKNAYVFILSAAAFGMLTGMICGTKMSEYNRASRMNDYGRTKAYTSYMVTDGDTVWDIASDLIILNPEYNDVRQYVHEIESINVLDDGIIMEGCYIIIPYFIDPDRPGYSEIMEKYGLDK